MADSKHGRSNAEPANPSVGESAAQTVGEVVPAWLLRHRVTIPNRSPGHIDRPELRAKCIPSGERWTLLHAGAGFGKTTLLADCCRELRRRGTATAWLSVDERDDPGTLDSYLAFAFQEAGLDVPGPPRDGSDVDVPQHRTALLARAIEARGSPCVLALDELERLANPQSVALIGYLLRHAAPQLHVAVACRELPPGLDVAGPLQAREGRIVTAADLRFSNAEIAELFGKTLSRRALAAVAADSGGWPIALHIRRNAGDAGDAESPAGRDLLANWMDARLLRRLAAGERDFVLDVGLFEWFDAALLDEVLEQTDGMRRLDELPALSGLLEPVRGAATGVRSLHGLMRGYCERWRRRRTPERYRTVQRRIATALARRGDTVAAMRHAAQAGEPGLVGRILADAGPIRLWLTEGAGRLVVAERYLTESVLGSFPGLALVRCVARTVSGRAQEARREFAAATRAAVADEGSAVDRFIVRGWMALLGCEAIGSEEFQGLFAETERLAQRRGVDPLLRSVVEYGLCYVHGGRAEFEAALRHGAQAKRLAAGSAPYVAMCVDFQLGQIAMAQGRVAEAAKCYRRAQRVVRGRFLQEPRPVAYGQVLAWELDLERNRIPPEVAARGISIDTYRACPQFSAYAAASELGMALSLATAGTDAALSTLEEMLDYARESDLPVLERHLSVLRAAVNADAGRLSEAERIWRTEGLPESDDGCLDVRTQSWREMEALSCTRVALHEGKGDFETARALARRIADVGMSRGLRRTRMRALALLTAIESRSGNREEAAARLSEFLDAFAETDYARPLVREGEVVVGVIEDYLDAHPDTPHEASADALLNAVRTKDAPVPLLSVRETEVLQRLETQTDKEIGAALGITPDGVRYYVRRIFRKLDVHSRFQAVRQARDVGLLRTEG